nr:hypothetical protein [uncultured Kingella sp.]
MEKFFTQHIAAADETEFQVAFIREEGAGVLTTRSGRHYLMLDSIDYWFDLIQSRSPVKKKCRCKNDWFKVDFVYTCREDDGEVREVEVRTVCTECARESPAMRVEIDYAPTGKLVSQPLYEVKNPKLKYKYHEIFCYWNELDFVAFFDELARLGCHFYVNGYDEADGQFRTELSDLAEAVRAVEEDSHYGIYISRKELDFGRLGKEPFRKGELIELKSSIAMGNTKPENRLYEIVFCTQYIQGEALADKSDEFARLTEEVRRYVKKHKKRVKREWEK